MARTHLLNAQNLHFEYPNRRVLESVTLGIDSGDRIGIVGRNGEGKSTLIRLLAKQLSPMGGAVTWRNDVRVGMLGQADNVRPQARVREEIVGDQEEYVWASNPKIRSVISGLLSDIPWEGLCGELSGGQRRRVALAALLVREWDVLIFDEPTNHLDVEAISWLARYLREYWRGDDGACVVVTHDRWFLDEVCTRMWEVHDGIVEPFEGGYAAYVLQRVERDRQAQVAEAKRQNTLRRELAWLRRGAPARTSKPRFRIDAANELIADVPELRKPLELQRLAMSRLGKDVIDLLDVEFRYSPESQPVIRHAQWLIGPGERAAILGRNGSGKSTLLGLISGVLTPTSGRVKRGKSVKLAIVDQEFSQLALIGDERVREVLARYRTAYVVSGKELSPAQMLERLGFSREYLSHRVNELSGGQKRRLQLLLVLLDEPNVLVLDEPTNDVDTDMLTVLEEVLDSWPGTLIVVSHDRYFIERVTDRQYAIFDGVLRDVPGGVDEYLSSVNNADERESGKYSHASSEVLLTDSEAMMDGAQKRKLEKQISSLERKMEKANRHVEEILLQMAEADQSDYEKISTLDSRLRAARTDLEEAEMAWLEVSEALENSGQ